MRSKKSWPEEQGDAKAKLLMNAMAYMKSYQVRRSSNQQESTEMTVASITWKRKIRKEVLLDK